MGVNSEQQIDKETCGPFYLNWAGLEKVINCLACEVRGITGNVPRFAQAILGVGELLLARQRRRTAIVASLCRFAYRTGQQAGFRQPASGHGSF